VGAGQHQTLDAAATNAQAGLAQRLMNLGAAIRLAACIVCVPDQSHKLCVIAATRAHWPSLPGVVSARADAVEPAEQPHRDVLLSGDEGEDVPFRSEVNAIAFS